ncbi:MAG: insulinase family protein [Spirochaetes bacterium]|jgi:predicted Zn-dependent peptidase|nr:insulinase family protein [Spirochaetota bacterium]
MKRSSVLMPLFFIFFSLASAHGSEIGDAGEYLRRNVVEKRLPNGITLIMLDRGYAPVLAFEISFRVGSVDESYSTAGAAHLLEHMLFKGTDRIGTRDFKKEGPIQREIEAVGETLDRLKLEKPGNSLVPELEKRLRLLQEKQQAYVESSPYDKIYTENGGVGFNASTSVDKTGYYIELPSSKIDLWARLESERLRNPVLREYYQERNNVVQERLMRYDASGSGGMFERFSSTAFIAHPYRHPIIGWRSGIPYLSVEDVKDFYRSHYIPSRMTITIVGKQDTDKTFRVIEKYFGSLPSGPEPREIPVREPEQKGERRFRYLFESTPFVMVGWHKPKFPGREDYICEIISEVLAGGKSSRLYKRLVLEKKLATSVSSWNGYPGARYDNMIVIYATPAPSVSPEDVENEIYGEIDDFSRNAGRAEIERVVNKIESEMVFGLSSNKGLASLLSYYQTVFGGWRYAADYLPVIKGIGPEDVKNVLSRYFNRENRTVGILVDTRKAK